MVEEDSTSEEGSEADEDGDLSKKAHRKFSKKKSLKIPRVLCSEPLYGKCTDPLTFGGGGNVSDRFSSAKY